MIPESLCKYSSRVSFTIQLFKVQKRSRNVPGKQLHSLKKRQREGERVLWLCSCVQMWRMNKEIHKSRRWLLWCVCSFSQSTDPTTRWRSARAADRTATTPNTWTRSSAPSKVCVCVMHRCLWRVNRCVCVSEPSLTSLSLLLWFHVSLYVSVWDQSVSPPLCGS